MVNSSFHPVELLTGIPGYLVAEKLNRIRGASDVSLIDSPFHSSKFDQMSTSNSRQEIKTLSVNRAINSFKVS